MTITLNGNGTVTGVSVGGLPDGIVDTDMLAANAVTRAKSNLPGSILQAVTDVDEGSMTTNSTSWQWQGLDVTITPSSTSSRILLLCTLGMDGSSNIAFITLYRGTDNLGSSEGFAGAQHPARCISGLTYLDSPSSTSALQYRIAVRNSDNSTTVECPPWANGHQTLTALEIAG